MIVIFGAPWPATHLAQLPPRRMPTITIVPHPFIWSVLACPVMHEGGTVPVPPQNMRTSVTFGFKST